MDKDPGPVSGLSLQIPRRARTLTPRLRGRGPAFRGHVLQGQQRGGGCGGSDGGP